MFVFPKNTKPAILGITSTVLLKEEIDLFKKCKPFGIILFQRNCETPEQVRVLTQQIRDVLGFDCPILIDQEGGRVSRLKNPAFEEFSAPASFKTEGEVYQNAQKMAKQLRDLGINVNCTPLVDLVFEKTHKIIGDRSFGNDVSFVASMAAAVVNAHYKEGVIPIIKHLPGHGRAAVDSHEELPRVDENLETLEQNDFLAFKKCLDLVDKTPWGMTAHIIFSAVDKINCATQSSAVISDIIRKKIGFEGILISDCLTMKALKGSYAERAQKSLKAGCNYVLHCSGALDGMEDILLNI